MEIKLQDALTLRDELDNLIVMSRHHGPSTFLRLTEIAQYLMKKTVLDDDQHGV